MPKVAGIGAIVHNFISVGGRQLRNPSQRCFRMRWPMDTDVVVWHCWLCSILFAKRKEQCQTLSLLELHRRFGDGFCVLVANTCEIALQGYLAHKKQHPPKTLQ